MRESDRKAWVHFVPPRWVYPGAAICGVPSEVSRAMLRGWYAENGVSLGNPRLGFVCTAQTTDGQHGLAGYFLEHDRALAPDERLVFRPGELAPPFDAAAAPTLPAAEWPAARLAKATRNYAMEYVRTGLPRLTEVFGPAEAAHLGRVAGHLIGAQSYQALAQAAGIGADDAHAFGRLMGWLAAAEGDVVELSATATARPASGVPAGVSCAASAPSRRPSSRAGTACSRACWPCTIGACVCRCSRVSTMAMQPSSGGCAVADSRHRAE